MPTGIGVQFKQGFKPYGGKVYTYLADFVQGAKVGDIVIVDMNGNDVKAQVCSINVPADVPNIEYKQIKAIFEPEE